MIQPLQTPPKAAVGADPSPKETMLRGPMSNAGRKNVKRLEMRTKRRKNGSSKVPGTAIFSTFGSSKVPGTAQPVTLVSEDGPFHAIRVSSNWAPRKYLGIPQGPWERIKRSGEVVNGWWVQGKDEQKGIATPAPQPRLTKNTGAKNIFKHIPNTVRGMPLPAALNVGRQDMVAKPLPQAKQEVPSSASTTTGLLTEYRNTTSHHASTKLGTLLFVETQNESAVSIVIEHSATISLNARKRPWSSSSPASDATELDERKCAKKIKTASTRQGTLRRLCTAD